MSPALMHACRFIALLLVFFHVGIAYAQQYPTRPIRVISPYPPGGGNDTLLRIIGDKVGEQVGHRIIVDNRPGANTIVGTEVAVKAAPDGYTFILLPNTFATNPAFYPKLPYDTKDLAPVAYVAQSPQFMVAHPSVPVRTVRDVVALARANPGQLTFGTTGTGSTGHLAMVLLSTMTGVKITQVSYKGAAQAANELVGGHIAFMITSMPVAMPQVRAGRLRPIAITTRQRARAIPEVPTFAESGVPGYETTQWYGILAPARTPDAIIKRMNAELGTALKSPDVIEKLSTQGVEPFHTSPEQFAAFIQAEVTKWSKVVRAADVKSELDVAR